MLIAFYTAATDVKLINSHLLTGSNQPYLRGSFKVKELNEQSKKIK
jgi:hypothetical protein